MRYLPVQVRGKGCGSNEQMVHALGIGILGRNSIIPASKIHYIRLKHLKLKDSLENAFSKGNRAKRGLDGGTTLVRTLYGQF